VVVLTPDGVVADASPADVREDPAASNTWLVPPSPPPRRSKPPGETLLTGRALRYRHRDADDDALTEVDCRADAGSVLGVSGPNGSGKTTLARLLGGLAEPTGGEVTAEAALTAGAAMRSRHPHLWRARDLAGRIGSVFQNPEHAFLTGRVRDELAVGPRAVGRPDQEAARTVDDLLQRMRLAALADANPFTLSGGEQRRLSVAAALASHPRLLLLDEPTFGQDPTTWRELTRLVSELRDAGAGVVVVTHDTAFEDAVADRRLVLRDGRAEPAT
jgi:energy-coupling factor transport system ATP-binding protein